MFNKNISFDKVSPAQKRIWRSKINSHLIGELFERVTETTTR